MIQKIESYITKYHMINTNDHVIAAVSGGADSICLLLVLMQLQQKLGYTLSVVHVEHGIRGSASLSDAEFVMHFCKERSIECHICHYSVPEYAKAHGMGEEEAGRHLRYASFAAEKKKYPGRNVRIATAHHLDDNAETMLFHLVRGSGISGMTGIGPVRDDIIRPLLCVNRIEIEAYLKDAGQKFCIDATNLSDQYVRNQMRHRVLPVLNQINGRAALHMYQTAEELREIDSYICRQAEKQSGMCCECRQDYVKIKKEPFRQIETVLQKEIIYQMVTKLAGSRRNITREHIHQIQELFDKQIGRKSDLPYGLSAERVYEGVEIFHKKKQDINLSVEDKERFSFRVIEVFSNFLPQISKKKYTKCFDYDKIKFGFCIRKRLPGDYLTVDDSGARQKLKKYFVNEKIPAKEREQLLLLADGSHIMWVVGHRISSFYKVDEYTRRILEVTFYGGRESE